MKTFNKYIGIVLGIVLVSVFCFYVGLSILIPVLLIPQKTPIEEIKLDSGQTIKIWYQTGVNQDYPTIHYEITQTTEVIVPGTMILVDSYIYPPYDLDECEIEIAFARDKTLVCIYDPMYWDEGFLILYDTQTGESWPYMWSSELWRNRYVQLTEENPDLPAVDYVMGDEIED